MCVCVCVHARVCMHLYALLKIRLTNFLLSIYLEATQTLRAMGVKTPIVALTANALQLDKELFFHVGVDYFQTKVNIHILVHKFLLW